MALHDRVQQLRDELLAHGREPVAPELRGVSKGKVRSVLAQIDLATEDIVDVIYALLDDTQPSWFARAPEGATFASGASTAQIGCHVGILQRGRGKLDREGRDYWLKPLWQIGAVEKVFLDSASRRFVPGHPRAKSANSAYRLAADFLEILRAPSGKWEPLLASWTSEDRQRERLALQGNQAERAASGITRSHSTLIAEAVRVYAPHFLHGYQTVYLDDGDGDRVSPEDEARLSAAGLSLGLEDAMPDILLWNPETDGVWIVEAVTSDGEVDQHKMEQTQKMAKRAGKSGVGFTTVYPDWRTAATRQGRLKNIPGGTFIWILEDPGRCYEVHWLGCKPDQR